MFGIDAGDLKLEGLLLAVSVLSAGISSFGTYMLTGRKKLKIEKDSAQVDMANKLIESADKILDEMKEGKAREKVKRLECEERVEKLEGQVELLSQKVEECFKKERL